MTKLPERKTVISACRNCHGGCTARLDIEDGKVVRISPDPNSPLSGGRMCPKGLSGRELLYHPDRLKYPMKRAGERGEGKWTRISWDEAYAAIEENIHTITAKWGREAIAIAQGTGRHHINQTMRFANTLETPNWIEPGFAQCFFPRINVGNMTFGGFPVCDYYGSVNPECILVWGHNHWISGPSGESRYLIMDAIKRGSSLIVIDPRRTELSRKAELWIRPRPGTDAAVALGMLNVIVNENLYDKTFVDNWCHGFEDLKQRLNDYPLDTVSEISWVPKEQIIAAARMFAAAKPGTVEWGLALEHTPNCIQACRAVALIPAVTGNIDIPGGWIKGENIMPPAASNIDRLTAEQRQKRLGGEAFQLLGGLAAFSPSAHIPTVFNAIMTGKPYPVRAMMLFGNNGLISFADTGYTYKVLKSLDFISAMDLFLTPTNELADLVLPAASWMELDELIAMPGMAAHTVLAQQMAVRTHECKSDEEVFLELSQRLDLDWGAETTKAILDQQLSVVSAKFPEFKGLNFEQMKERHYISVPIRYRKHETDPNGFGTPTCKVELYSTIMEKLGYDPLPAFVEPPESPNSRPDLAEKYPIILTTGGRSLYYFCSENRQVPTCRKGHPFPFVDIHPKTADAYEIQDGDWVYIENTRGRITQKARVTDTMLPGVINCEYGWWYPEVKTPDHGVWISNVNVLTSMDPPYDPAMGTYQLRGLLCRIYKNDDDTPESLAWTDRVINKRRTAN